MVSEDRLKSLGDPSGHNDAEYWNEWFDIVCKQDHRSFEWYCGCEEVIRVMKHHMALSPNAAVPNDDDHDDNQPGQIRMIHPGSGTSLLPLEMRKVFPFSEQVVLDVAELALEEMKQFHEKSSGDGSAGTATSTASDVQAQGQEQTPIQYVLTDVLNPPLDFEAASFDAWIDKGFIDAVFDKNQAETSSEVSKRLFEEAGRLLKPGVGTLLVVTLAESHSLDLIVTNWLDGMQRGIWNHTLHIWEMAPVSGNMLPFGIALTKAAPSSSSSSPSTIQPSTTSNDGPTVNDLEKYIAWHANSPRVESTPAQLSPPSPSTESEHIIPIPKDDKDNDVNQPALEIATAKIQKARDEYMQRKQSEEGTGASATASDLPISDSSNGQTMLTFLEIKPYEAGLNMNKLGELLTTMQWNHPDGGPIHPRWQPANREQDPHSLVEVVPIGFGISKIRLCCIIGSDDIDDLTDAIDEWEGDGDTFEGVQSVDVDWDHTVPVMDASSLPIRR